ncbi:restriction endonuclease subunit S [Campylobacter devanensis]|uniref:restriction endonuclease subunit S n=1 Tax=Campylobacter devanensis TaxID=3161138 RepID=UPI000A33A4B1|nr:restriction endonuclease subunit S [Campylobacter sp. P160]
MKSPKIRFKEFQNDWNSRILGEVCNKFDNLRIPIAENLRKKGNIPYYGANGIQDYVDGYTHDGEFVLIAEDGANDIKNYPVQYVNGKIWVNNHAHVLQGKNGILNNIFLNYSISSINFEPFLVGGGRAKLNASVMDNLTFRIPSDIKEQEKIGEFFRKIDGILDLENSRFKKLENFKKTMLDKLFVKDGADEPQIRLGSFKGEWNSRILGDIGETYCGLSGKNKDDFGHGNAKFVPYINIFQNSIVNLAKLEKIEIDKRQNSVKNGDIFFTTSSETPQEVAMSSVYLGNEENIYLNSFCFGFRPKEFLNSYFLAYFFRSHYFRDKVIPLAQGISRYNISKNKMMELKIRIPNDIKEQEAIGEFFRKMDGILEFSQKKITKLENIKKYLLNKMFM